MHIVIRLLNHEWIPLSTNLKLHNSVCSEHLTSKQTVNKKKKKYTNP
jgi:hypothetical protein